MIIGRDRRRIDQLHGHVFPGHHGRGGHGGGKRIGRDLGRRSGQAGDQLALAGVGTAQDNRRAGSLARNAQAVGLFAAALFRGHLFFDLADFRFQLGLKMVGPLMLGNLLEHHLQALQFFFDTGRPAVFLLGFAILLCKIGGHIVSNYFHNAINQFLHNIIIPIESNELYPFRLARI